ncbi:MAG: glycosyltransferase family 2 protein [Opitutae bacterium]|nr:glycosyltransferase family 2 protein [Opitutae bacterium]
MSYAVIIPSYNRPDMLKRALASVYAQTLLPSQICLTIDEPEDSEKYAFLGDYDDALQVTYTGGGFGGAKARNVGLDRVGDVDYVFFLDDDDEWLPEKIEKQIQLLENRPDVVGVTCYYYRIQAGERRLVAKGSEEQINRNIRIWNYIGGFSCFGLRWNSKVSRMRINPSLSSCQDFDFYMECAKAGAIALLTEPSVHYFAHVDGRISDGRQTKGKNFDRILKARRLELSVRERCFTAAKAHLFAAPFESGRGLAIFRFLLGTFYLIFAFSLPEVSRQIWFACLRGILAEQF